MTERIGGVVRLTSVNIRGDGILYVGRWLTTPFEIANGCIAPARGVTSRARVVSPILTNLFVH